MNCSYQTRLYFSLSYGIDFTWCPINIVQILKYRQSHIFNLNTTLWNKVYQWFATGQWFTTGQWFSPGPPVSSTSKTDRHDISEILLKVALSAINQMKPNKIESPFRIIPSVFTWSLVRLLCKQINFDPSIQLVF